MHEHADVPLGTAGDPGDLFVGEALAPEVDRLPLRARQILDERADPSGQIMCFGDMGRIGFGDRWL